MKNKVTYLGKHGYDIQREQANKVLEIDKQYVVTGGYMGRSSSYFELEGFDQTFNTVMFDAEDGFDWDILEDGYSSDYTR